MNHSATCPCCGRVILRHLSRHREYWFCRSCWQEMPNFVIAKKQLRSEQNHIFIA